MAETGVLRATQDVSVQRAISGSTYRDFPAEHHFALEIRDRAMDAAAPIPLSLGTFALCLDLVRAKLVVESDKIYAVRRWRAIDGERLEEIIIRRAQVFSDRVELAAESLGHFERITIPGALSTNPEAPCHAFGLVYGCTGYCYP
jgi:hypothetical protein